MSEPDTSTIQQIKSNDQEVLKSTLHELSERMTCHGLQDLYKAKSKVSFAFWACVLIICTATLSYSIYRCLIEFYENPILTSNEVDSSEVMQFPDLTICPPDFINYTKLKQINTDNPYAGKRVWDFKDRLVSKVSDLIDGRTFFSPGDHELRYDPYTWSINVLLFSQQMKSLAEQHQEIFNASLDINQFILKSPIEDIKHTLDLENGICYVLNATGGKVNQIIPHMGINVLVNIDQGMKNDSNPNFTPLVDGITVRTGRPEYHPMARGGTFISPGSFAKLSLSVKKEHFISVSGFTNIPTHCVKDGDVELSVLNVSYSQEACEVDCYAHYELETYGCIIMTNITFLRKQIFKQNLRACASMKYYKRYRETGMLHNCFKKCYKECDLTTYEVAVTILKIPSNNLLHQLKANKNLAIGNLCPRLKIINASWTNESCLEDDRQQLAIKWKKCKLSTYYAYQQGYNNVTLGLKTCNETQISEIEIEVNEYNYKNCQKPCNDSNWTNALNEAEQWNSKFILIEVVFQEFKTRVVSQRQSMTAIALLSNLGGTLGLWLGASLFTILQISVLLLEACVGFCERRKQGRISEKCCCLGGRQLSASNEDCYIGKCANDGMSDARPSTNDCNRNMDFEYVLFSEVTEQFLPCADRKRQRQEPGEESDVTNGRLNRQALRSSQNNNINNSFF